MSTPSPDQNTTAARPSSAKRYLFVMLLGLVIGGVAAVMGMRALQERQDPFPDALMHVQGWHMGQLDDAVKANKCSPTDALPHLQALRMTAGDIENAFPDLRDDQRFSSAAAALRAATDKAIAAPPLSCAALTATIKSVGETCSGCHRDYKN
ncbi:MAG: cytochrome c [Proteobacteria bacterium]|nr:cytochrome c [Pseudomonadota bacterium]